MKRLTAMVVLVVLIATACSSSRGTNPASDGPVAQIVAIDVVGPDETGAGQVPQFEWEPVEDAAEYGVVVRDADGEAVWAWRGPTTEIWFGGLSQDRPAGMAGPVVTSGSTWIVAAYDEEGHVVAVGAERGLDPD